MMFIKCVPCRGMLTNKHVSRTLEWSDVQAEVQLLINYLFVTQWRDGANHLSASANTDSYFAQSARSVYFHFITRVILSQVCVYVCTVARGLIYPWLQSFTRFIANKPFFVLVLYSGVRKYKIAYDF